MGNINEVCLVEETPYHFLFFWKTAILLGPQWAREAHTLTANKEMRLTPQTKQKQSIQTQPIKIQGSNSKGSTA